MSLPILLNARDTLTPSPALLATRDDAPRQVLLTPEGPVVWLVTRYDECRAVLSDRRFLGTSVEPEHGADMRPRLYRSASWPGGDMAARKRIAPLLADTREALITSVVEELLDDIERTGGPVDLCSQFTFPLPARIVCTMLGVDADNVDQLARWAHDVVTSPFVIDSERVEDSWRNLTHHLGGDELAVVLFVAGHETTKVQLDYGIVALIQHPDQLAKLDDHLDTAIEEILRYAPIGTEGTPRIASRDLEVGGVTIPAGAVVLVGAPAANFDDGYFDNPMAFDITRKQARHFTFGHGAQYCVGAALARAQLKIAIPALFRRFPKLKIDQDNLRFRPTLAGGFEELIATW